MSATWWKGYLVGLLVGAALVGVLCALPLAIQVVSR